MLIVRHRMDIGQEQVPCSVLMILHLITWVRIVGGGGLWGLNPPSYIINPPVNAP